MKFAFASLSGLLLAASAVAQEYQSTFVTAPTNGQNVQSGKKFNVTLNTPNMLSSIQFVEVIISMKGCEIDPCDSYVDNPLISGNVLYDGAYKPTPVSSTSGLSGSTETFTVTAPQYGNGPAKLFVTHRYNLGASLLPMIEFLNTTVSITGGPY